MTTELISYSDMQAMAKDIASSGLFGMKKPDQVLALMCIAQAEGKHPAIIARDYDIIQNRPAKKAEAMLRDFIESGGKVEWHTLTDEAADATFSHPSGGTVRISWDQERAKQAGVSGKDMYKKYPRQMLRSRVVSEGVRTVCPLATSGFYVPEEVKDFSPIKEKSEPTPPVSPKDDSVVSTQEGQPDILVTGYLSASEVTLIRGLAEQAKLREKRLCEAYGVESLEKIPAELILEVKARIQKYAEKNNKAASA